MKYKKFLIIILILSLFMFLGCDSKVEVDGLKEKENKEHKDK